MWCMINNKIYHCLWYTGNSGTINRQVMLYRFKILWRSTNIIISTMCMKWKTALAVMNSIVTRTDWMSIWILKLVYVITHITKNASLTRAILLVKCSITWKMLVLRSHVRMMHHYSFLDKSISLIAAIIGVMTSTMPLPVCNHTTLSHLKCHRFHR